MPNTEPVIRFCPKCGAKVKGPIETFQAPQNCPSCKASVLFWDVTIEPAGDLVEALGVKPLVSRNSLFIGIGISAGCVLFALLLFAVGFVGVPFVIAMFLMVAGGYCIAVFFGQQHFAHCAPLRQIFQIRRQRRLPI